MRSSVHIDNKKKDIAILIEHPTDGLNTIMTAEKESFIDVTEQKKKNIMGEQFNEKTL